MQSVFNWDIHNFGMNKRLVLVGIVLGSMITFAVIIGSPANPLNLEFGGFDTLR
jgi:hypothetical protein